MLWLAKCLTVVVPMLLAMVLPTVAKESRVALIVSNANYENAPVLSTPPLDADSVARTLKTLGFDSVKILTDATGEELRKRLRDFSLESRLADVSVLYYAGHGLETDGQNYLVPVDARLEYEGDIAFETVSIDLAVRAVNGAKHLKLLILDACRNNPFATKTYGGGAQKFGVGLAPIETPGNVLVSYSAAAGQIASDGTPGTNSPFAKALSRNLRTPGVDIRRVLGRVRDEVLASTQQQQRPFIYASLGGDPIFLVPPPNTSPVIPISPVVVDLTIADPDDEAVEELLGYETRGEFGYEFLEPAQGSVEHELVLQLVPSLDYFKSKMKRGRPLIYAESYGYFAPDEGGGGWPLARPLVDLIARRAKPTTITLSDLVLEVEESTPDYAPYVSVLSSSTDIGQLVLVNQGWSDVRNATLEYTIVGLDKPTLKSVERLLSSHAKTDYEHRARVGSFRDFAFISLKEGITKSFVKELPARRANTDSADQEGLWIVGRLTVESTRAGEDVVVADVVANVPIFAPEGLGGGYIEYNLSNNIDLRAEGSSYKVRRSIGYLLDNDSKTFRGLYPLSVKQTSRHRFRMLVKGDGGANLYISPWIEAHIVVPRFEARVEAWSKKDFKSPMPLSGVR